MELTAAYKRSAKLYDVGPDRRRIRRRRTFAKHQNARISFDCFAREGIIIPVEEGAGGAKLVRSRAESPWGNSYAWSGKAGFIDKITGAAAPIPPQSSAGSAKLVAPRVYR